MRGTVTLGSILHFGPASGVRRPASGVRWQRDRAHLLSICLGSCDEVRALLEAAVAFGVLTAREQQEADPTITPTPAALRPLRGAGYTADAVRGAS